MKTLAKLLFFATVTVISLGVFVVTNPRSVSAEAARCYRNVQGQVSGISCNDGQITPFFNLIGQPQPDTCYLVYVDGPDIGQWPFGSTECFALAVQTNETTQQQGAVQRQNLQEAINNPQRVECGENDSECIRNIPLVQLINQGINILSAVVVVIIIAVIVMAGIQYSAAGGNPQGTAAAKGRIVNAIIALVAYLLLFMLFQWLIPGGLV